jgi:hypothetical protein
MQFSNNLIFKTMKNLINYAVLFGFILAFSACSKEEEQGIKQENAVSIEQSFSDLNSQLATYNQEFLENNPIPPSFLKRINFNWGKIIKAIKADASGAVTGSTIGGTTGAIVGGVLYSLSEIFEKKPDTSTPTPGNDNDNGSDKAVTSSGNSYNFGVSTGFIADEVGYYHNLIIERLLNNEPDLSNKTQLEIINLIINEAGKFGFNFPTTQIPLLQENLVADRYILEQYSDDEIISSLIMRYPNLSNELNVVGVFLNTISQYYGNEDVIIEYTEGVINILENSEIPESSESTIRSSISVGANSSLLWRE